MVDNRGLTGDNCEDMACSLSFSDETDLELDRVLFASPQTVWRCWTDPALFKQWFSPHPAVVEDVRFDLRPGGECYTRMRSPKG